MAIKTSKSIFYHIPKTGGVWVKEAMRRSIKPPSGYARTRGDYEWSDDEIIWLKMKLAHTLQLKREHRTQWEIPEKDRKGLFSFTFVRKPFEWYKSFWAHRKFTYDKGMFKPAFPLDFAWDANFEQFIKNSIWMFPHGFVTLLYQCYLGRNGDELDFVGKQENLREDLIKAMTLAGEDFDPEFIRRFKRMNVFAAKLNPEDFEIKTNIFRTIMRKEVWVTRTFYQDGSRN